MAIKISSDSTCDLSPELIAKYDINIVHLYVNKGGKAYRDGIDIVPDDIYEHVAAGGELTSTAAVPPVEYTEVFKKYSDEYDAVIHVNISSKFSSCYQNAYMAAQEFDNVYVVDSMNLSTGHGHVVLEAAAMAQEGMDAKTIVEKLNEIIPKVNASFILDSLKYLSKGGRCSSVAALGANVLSLKPCIEVVDGAMRVGTKYRGSFEKSLRKYVKERLEGNENLRLHRIFVTHSGVPQEHIDIAKNAIMEYADFEEIVVTRAGCTVSSHCGPGTLGILYITK